MLNSELACADIIGFEPADDESDLSDSELFESDEESENGESGVGVARVQPDREEHIPVSLDLLFVLVTCRPRLVSH